MTTQHGPDGEPTRDAPTEHWHACAPWVSDPADLDAETERTALALWDALVAAEVAADRAAAPPRGLY